MTDDLPCMNCKKPVPQANAKMFAAVFICPECLTMAEHFWERLERELRNMLLLGRESIRLALIQGKFFFPVEDGREVSKKEVFEEILRMQEAKEKACQTTNDQLTPTRPSTGSTRHTARESAAAGDDFSSTTSLRG